MEAPAKPDAYVGKPKTRNWAFNVAGVTFRRQAALGFVRMAKENPPPLRLVPEPSNEHDANAVRVEAIMQRWCCRRVESDRDDTMHCPEHGDAVRVQHAVHCGYVPREFAPWIGALMRQGRVVEVKVLRAATLANDPDTPSIRVKVVYRA